MVPGRDIGLDTGRSSDFSANNHSILIGQPPLIRLPGGLPILLGLLDRILRFNNAPSDNNHITARVLHEVLRRAILLSQRIAAAAQSHSRAHDDEVLVVAAVAHRALRNKANDEIAMGASHRDGFRAVLPPTETAGAAHLREHQEPAVVGLLARDVAQPADDALAGHGVRVRDVCPGRNVVDAGAVLQLHGAADVGELAVLKDEEVVADGEGGERGGEGGNGGRCGEGDDVDVCFDEAELRAEG